MQLTRFTDLGLRAVMLLASGEFDERRVTTGQIAANAGASETTLPRLFRGWLNWAWYRPGAVGSGAFLTDAGRAASVGWLVRELEGDREVIVCEGDTPCPLIAGCRLRRALADAKEAFYAELDRYTVADLARSPALQLIQLIPSERTPR